MIGLSDVLVVDDEDVVLSAVGRILSAQSVAHRLVSSAEEALEEIGELPPDLLLADVKLPGLSGLELIRRCTEHFPSILSLCMTGYANTEHVLLSLEVGSVDFLPKPFTVQEILSVLARADRIKQLRERDKICQARSGCLLLDLQTWARPEDDGTVTLGVTDVFLRTVRPIQSVSVPEVNTMLQQGGVLSQVTTESGFVHPAWCAMGGRVVEPHEDITTDASSIGSDPYGSGWIARVIPFNFEQERSRLQVVP